MKKFIIQAVLLLVVIGIALFFFSPTNQSPKLDLPFFPQKQTLSKLEIGGVTLNVEIANTASKRNKGLSDRVSLGQDEGMLFIFQKLDKYAFWMKGLKFPLDFVWIKDNTVVDILQNILPPAPGQKDESLPIYSSKVEFDKVLEVNAGVIQKLNIKVGDIVKLSL